MTGSGPQRKICVVTGSRAEYGLLAPLMRLIDADDTLALQLLVTGSHLSAVHGETWRQIEADGFAIDAKLDLKIGDDSGFGISCAMARGLALMAKRFDELAPDVIVLLGDRYEILAAAEAALIARIPVAHIHGGELTGGAMDDAIRHAITKMAHLHFVAAPDYAARVRQLGEDPASIHVVGAMAYDGISDMARPDTAALSERVGVDVESGGRDGGPLLLVTYHPATLGDLAPEAAARELTSALDGFPDARIVFTGVNADPGYRVVASVIEGYATARSAPTACVDTLGQANYIALMERADAVIGNSSSGVIEAPFVGTPTVNIGPRQDGRLRSVSVIDCAEDAASIGGAIRSAVSPEFARRAAESISPLGSAGAAARVLSVLKSADLNGATRKIFHDLPTPAFVPSFIPGRTEDTGVYVIAEAGVNHNGDPALARALVDAAAEAGADAVKFQTFDPAALATDAAPKAAYQKAATGDEGSQQDMLRALALDEATHRDLMAHCKDRKIDFLSTPFDTGSLDFLANGLSLPTLKLGSGEVTNGPLLLAAAQTGCDLILSTGMSTLAEVVEALGVFAFGYTQAAAQPGRRAFAVAWHDAAGRRAVQNKVTLLHCTSAYPAPVADANLLAMTTLATTTGCRVGYSDHTTGLATSVAAVGLGAQTIEKHLTLDRTMTGPDHAASIEPKEFAELVQLIREAACARGSMEKRPASSERDTMAVARKSVVAARPVAAGAVLSADDLAVKRPGTGRSPMDFWSLIGQSADRAYAADEVIGS